MWKKENEGPTRFGIKEFSACFLLSIQIFIGSSVLLFKCSIDEPSQLSSQTIDNPQSFDELRQETAVNVPPAVKVVGRDREDDTVQGAGRKEEPIKGTEDNKVVSPHNTDAKEDVIRENNVVSQAPPIVVSEQNVTENNENGQGNPLPKISSEPKSGLININTADLDELISLPGIGKILAEQIIMQRKENPFSDAEDLKRRVYGIGQKRLERIRDLISF